ncbi:DUF2927 domain-containing protein [Wenxinia saemankumensis]|uniref:DUF2927 domain-containing protein n=1 Tax=Wenxinia saemankumensis TaxID=1447782 RepID=A0A1M6HG54_9RHOB|nr:DUF2927 domain-containing protein [Wenxinia saemankumensis]SHJ21153.1 Protein of unknown function [Wenxinia saemankumensis]
MIRPALAAAALALAGCGAPAPAPGPAPDPAPPAVTRAESGDWPPMRRPAGAAMPGPTRSHAEMAQDILDLVFALESGRPVPRLTRFEGPITVGAAGPLPPTLPGELAALVRRLRTEAGLPIAAGGGVEARIVIVGVPRAELGRAVPGAACFTVPGVSSWGEYLARRGSPATDWTALTTRDRVAIFLPRDTAPQEVRDCLHEELAQALGPLNDLHRLPDSVFNDDNIHGALTGFDMLALRAIYAPELRSGMGRGDVAARLPGILARLDPGGLPRPSGPARDAPAAWREAIGAALSSGNGVAGRRAAALRAVSLSAGAAGPERGFSHYVLGRLTLGSDPARAGRSFAAAAEEFARRPETALHGAHAALYLAGEALRTGDPAGALGRAGPATAIALRHEDAALAASLLMVQAGALSALGRPEEARAARLDSLAWGRYGFGADRAVQDRLSEIARLAP